MAQQIQKRYDTAANWALYNPILMIAEEGLEIDTGKFKNGNGVDHWLDLPYYGENGSTEVGWDYITNKPVEYNPISHNVSHSIGGDDPISPSDIGAEPEIIKKTAFNRDFGIAVNTVTQGNDVRLSNSRKCNNTFDDVSIARTNLSVYSKSESDNNFQATIPVGNVSQYYRGDKTFQILDKNAVGLNNLTNEAQIPLSQKAAINGVATLDSNGKLLTSQLPALAISETYVCASEEEMLALNAQRGDFCIRLGIQKNFILNGDDASVLSNWVELLTPSANVLSVNGQTGNIILSTADVDDSLDRRYVTDNTKTLITQNANASLTGLLSNTDWVTFNDKVSTNRTISTSGGIVGGGDLSVNRTLSLTYGTTVNTVCQGNDVRLSDSRNPLAHTHPIIDVINLSNELNNRILVSTRGVANGVATLDAGVTVPDNQLASNIVRKVDNRITIGAVNFNSTQPSLLEDGDMYFDTVSNTTKVKNNGLEQFIVRNLWVQTALNEISASITASTSVLTGSGGAGIGELTFPANFWIAGRTLKISISGHIVSTNRTSITPSVELGGVTLNVPNSTGNISESSTFSIEVMITAYSPTEFWVEGIFSVVGVGNKVQQVAISRITDNGTPTFAIISNPNSIDVLVAKGRSDRLTVRTTSAVIMVVS